MSHALIPCPSTRGKVKPKKNIDERIKTIPSLKEFVDALKDFDRKKPN
jgi:hypothetical protein